MSKFEVENKQDNPLADLALATATCGLSLLLPKEYNYTVRDEDSGNRFSVRATNSSELGKKIASGDMEKI